MRLKELLLENIGVRQTFLKNTFWLAISEAIFRFSQFFLLIYTIKILGVTEFGKFTFALSFVTIFSVLAEFGLSSIVTRELSQDKKIEKQYPDILSLRIILNIGALVLMLVGSFFITSDVVVRRVIWALSFSILTGNFSYIMYAFFRARQKMEYEAGGIILQALITAGTVFFILFNFPSIQAISLGYLFANFTALVLLLLFFNFFIHPVRLSFDKSVFKKFFLFSQPLGLAAIFNVIILNMDSVIMGRLGQVDANGWYSAARTTTNFIIVLATLIWISFFPVLSSFFKESKEKFQKIWDYYANSMFILAAPLVIGGFALAPKIISFMFGQRFVPSIAAFKILIFSAGINFIFNSYIMVLIVSGNQNKYLRIIFTAAIFNIVANIILIPFYSFYGASMVMLATNIFILLLAIKFSGGMAHISLFDKELQGTALAALASGLIMFAAIRQPFIYNLNVVFSILTGAVVYSGAFFVLYNFLRKPKWQTSP